MRNGIAIAFTNIPAKTSLNASFIGKMEALNGRECLG